MIKNIIAQEVAFDKNGWPINPTTGCAYTHDQIVADPTIPYPQHVDPANPGQYWQRRTAEELAAEKARLAKKTKIRIRRRSKSKRQVLTADAGLGPVSFAERQAEERGRATAALVDRANGRRSGDDHQAETQCVFIHCGKQFMIMEL
jgi:hypothetical protein